MNQIKKLFNFLVNDLKTDFYFVRDVFNGKVMNGTSKYVKNFKKIKNKSSNKPDENKSFLKTNHLLFIFIILSFLIGFYCSSKISQDKCNEFIQENYISPNILIPNPESTNISINPINAFNTSNQNTQKKNEDVWVG